MKSGQSNTIAKQFQNAWLFQPLLGTRWCDQSPPSRREERYNCSLCWFLRIWVKSVTVLWGFLQLLLPSVLLLAPSTSRVKSVTGHQSEGKWKQVDFLHLCVCVWLHAYMLRVFNPAINTWIPAVTRGGGQVHGGCEEVGAMHASQRARHAQEPLRRPETLLKVAARQTQLPLRPGLSVLQITCGHVCHWPLEFLGFIGGRRLDGTRRRKQRRTCADECAVSAAGSCSSARRALHYYADRMPSQLRQNKPSDVSSGTNAYGKWRESGCGMIIFTDGTWYQIDVGWNICGRNVCAAATSHVFIQKLALLPPHHTTVKLLHQSPTAVLPRGEDKIFSNSFLLLIQQRNHVLHGRDGL